MIMNDIESSFMYINYISFLPCGTGGKPAVQVLSIQCSDSKKALSKQVVSRKLYNI